MRRNLSLVIAVLMLAAGVTAQTSPDADALTSLLKEFLAGASRNDAAMHDRFWAEDLIYTGSAGRRIGKPDVMRNARSAPAPRPGDSVTTFTAEDIRIQQYGETAIVAFRLVGTTQREWEDRGCELFELRHVPQTRRQVAGCELAVDEDAPCRRSWKKKCLRRRPPFTERCSLLISETLETTRR